MSSTGVILVIAGQLLSVPFYIMAIIKIRGSRVIKGIVTEAIPEVNNDGYQVTIKAGDDIKLKTNFSHYVTAGMEYKLVVYKSGMVSVFDGYMWEFGVPMIISAATLPMIML